MIIRAYQSFDIDDSTSYEVSETNMTFNSTVYNSFNDSTSPAVLKLGPETTANNDEGGGSINIAVIVLLLVVFVIGMIGNFLIIFVILVLAEYKKVLTHWYVLQLAIADTIFLLTIPFRVAQDIQNSWVFPQWMCKAKETMFFLNYYASISFLVLMSIDRYIAICHRFSRTLNKFRTQFVTYLTTTAVWIISLLTCIPVMLYSTKVGTTSNCKCEFRTPDPRELVTMCEGRAYQRNTPEFNRCVSNFSALQNRQCMDITEDRTNFNETAERNPGCHYRNRGDAFKAFIYFNFIGMFLVPFIIMSICYTRIALRLRSTRIKTYQSARDNKTTPDKPVCKQKRSRSIVSIKDNQNRNRVTTMCFCLVVLFLCCWLPFHAIHLARMEGIDEDEKYCEELFHIAFVIAYFSVSSHSALNPCLYNFMGAKSQNRLRYAASSVRKSMQKRSVSLSTPARFQSSLRSRASSDTTTGNQLGVIATTTEKIEVMCVLPSTVQQLSCVD